MGHNPSDSWNNIYRLKHAAKDGMLVDCWCAYCRKGESYVASDLVDIFDPEMLVEDFGRTCTKCGLSSWTRTRPRHPCQADIGHLKVWRPSGVRTVQLWREEWYGP